MNANDNGIHYCGDGNYQAGKLEAGRAGLAGMATVDSRQDAASVSNRRLQRSNSKLLEDCVATRLKGRLVVCVVPVWISTRYNGFPRLDNLISGDDARIGRERIPAWQRSLHRPLFRGWCLSKSRPRHSFFGMQRFRDRSSLAKAIFARVAVSGPPSAPRSDAVVFAGNDVALPYVKIDAESDPSDSPDWQVFDSRTES